MQTPVSSQAPSPRVNGYPSPKPTLDDDILTIEKTNDRVSSIKLDPRPSANLKAYTPSPSPTYPIIPPDFEINSPVIEKSPDTDSEKKYNDLRLVTSSNSSSLADSCLKSDSSNNEVNDDPEPPSLVLDDPTTLEDERNHLETQGDHVRSEDDFYDYEKFNSSIESDTFPAKFKNSAIDSFPANFKNSADDSYPAKFKNPEEFKNPADDSYPAKFKNPSDSSPENHVDEHVVNKPILDDSDDIFGDITSQFSSYLISAQANDFVPHFTISEGDGDDKCPEVAPEATELADEFNDDFGGFSEFECAPRGFDSCQSDVIDVTGFSESLSGDKEIFSADFRENGDGSDVEKVFEGRERLEMLETSIGDFEEFSGFEHSEGTRDIGETGGHLETETEIKNEDIRVDETDWKFQGDDDFGDFADFSSETADQGSSDWGKSAQELTPVADDVEDDFGEFGDFGSCPAPVEREQSSFSLKESICRIDNKNVSVVFILL